MDTNTTLGNAGAGELVEALGQEWAVMPPTQGTKAAFEAWMKLQATKELLAERGHYAPSEFAAKERRLDASKGAGFYSWDSEVFQVYVASEPGAERLLWLMMLQKHSDMRIETLRAIKADNPEGLVYAYRAALAAASPSLYSPPETPRPAGVKPIPPDWPLMLTGSAVPSLTSENQTATANP